MSQQNITTMQDILEALNQNPDLQHEFHKHVVDVIRRDDELRQDLRKEILTEELLQLPLRFAQFEQAVGERFDNLESDVAVLKDDVAVLKDDVAVLKDDVAVLKDDVAVLKDDVAVLKDDVAVLKDDVAVLKDDVAVLKDDVAVLKDDVAVLKDDVAVLKDDVAVLKDDVAVLKDDVAVLKDDVAVLKDDMVDVKQQMNTMSGQIANLTGNDYETRAIEGSRRQVRRALGMEQATLVYASKQATPAEFEAQFLIPAIREGRITRQQADELEEADSIIRCENPDGEVVCTVVEISVTVQDHDRSRAAERAEIFNLATGIRTLAYTVGQDQDEPGPSVPDVPFLKY